MQEFTTEEGKRITIEPIEGSRLAGDVMIDIDGKKDNGVVLGGGLSGNVIIPTGFPIPKSEPKPSPEIPEPPERLAGNVVLRPAFGDTLMTLLEIKKTINGVINGGMNLEDLETLKKLVKDLENNYEWNEQYILDSNVPTKDKVFDANSVVSDNLKTIREATIKYQSDLDMNNEKGL